MNNEWADNHSIQYMKKQEEDDGSFAAEDDLKGSWYLSAIETLAESPHEDHLLSQQQWVLAGLFTTAL